MRAKIGVLPLYDSEKDSLWMVPGYMNGIIKAGGVPYILPLTTDNNILKEVCDEMDGFLFTGGQDVNPLLYTDKIQYYCNEICFERSSDKEIEPPEEILYLRKRMEDEIYLSDAIINNNIMNYILEYNE